MGHVNTLKPLVEALPLPVSNALRRMASMRPTHRKWLASQRDYAARRRVIDERVLAILGSESVYSGPFEGMRLLQDASWGHDFSGRLCGTYELEIHELLEKVLSRGVASVADIGCADGYYLVGLARRLPGVPVVGYDIDPDATRVSRRLADANDVAVDLRARCRPEDLVGLPKGSLIVCDCEGAELELITAEVVRANSESTFIIECHDMIRPGVTDTLLNRFAGREAFVVPSRPREASDAPFLPAEWAPEALNERRSPLSQWIVAL